MFVIVFVCPKRNRRIMKTNICAFLRNRTNLKLRDPANARLEHFGSPRISMAFSASDLEFIRIEEDEALFQHHSKHLGEYRFSDTIVDRFHSAVCMADTHECLRLLQIMDYETLLHGISRPSVSRGTWILMDIVQHFSYSVGQRIMLATLRGVHYTLLLNPVNASHGTTFELLMEHYPEVLIHVWKMNSEKRKMAIRQTLKSRRVIPLLSAGKLELWLRKKLAKEHLTEGHLLTIMWFVLDFIWFDVMRPLTMEGDASLPLFEDWMYSLDVIPKLIRLSKKQTRFSTLDYTMEVIINVETLTNYFHVYPASAKKYLDALYDYPDCIMTAHVKRLVRAGLTANRRWVSPDYWHRGMMDYNMNFIDKMFRAGDRPKYVKTSHFVSFLYHAEPLVSMKLLEYLARWFPDTLFTNIYTWVLVRGQISLMLRFTDAMRKCNLSPETYLPMIDANNRRIHPFSGLFRSFWVNRNFEIFARDVLYYLRQGIDPTNDGKFHLDYLIPVIQMELDEEYNNMLQDWTVTAFQVDYQYHPRNLPEWYRIAQRTKHPELLRICGTQMNFSA